MTPEERKEYNKKWREANRDKINAKNREPFECECGMILSRSNVKKHRNKGWHLGYMMINYDEKGIERPPEKMII